MICTSLAERAVLKAKKPWLKSKVAISTSETELSESSAQNSQRQCHQKHAGASPASMPALMVSIALAMLEPCPRMEVIWEYSGWCEASNM